ncbi:inositol-3-phosphate synthase [Thermostilla marina]
MKRVGLWLVGARGGVASCVQLGLAALRRGLIDTTGLVTARPEFAALDLVDWDRIVVGGCEIREGDVASELRKLARDSRLFEPELLDAAEGDLAENDARITWGTLFGAGEVITSLASSEVPRDATPRDAVNRIRGQLAAFREANDLERVIVVNVASTEPACTAALPEHWDDWGPLLDGPDSPLPASTIYAVAAIEEGCPHVNFTPSTASKPAAIDELARRRGVPHAGCDGKTGETLMKSVLGPMFRERNLEVMSWVGHNIFGNLDGKVLDAPQNKQSKVVSKDHLLAEILGYSPQTLVTIEYIQSMGDWKTAWDHIHFRGFLNTPMVLQFIWQGCDSILAAPLVIDLFRLTECAARFGEAGYLTFLAPFFKSPYGTTDQDFFGQTLHLMEWVVRRGQPRGE